MVKKTRGDIIVVFAMVDMRNRFENKKGDST